jgi:hypothetical protein
MTSATLSRGKRAHHGKHGKYGRINNQEIRNKYVYAIIVPGSVFSVPSVVNA